MTAPDPSASEFEAGYIAELGLVLLKVPAFSGPGCAASSRTHRMRFCRDEQELMLVLAAVGRGLTAE